MKVYKRKTLTTMFIVSAVLSVIQIVVMMILGGGGISAFGDSIFVALFVLIGGIALLPFVWMSMLLNWKKILIGFIAPIPILSSMKQMYFNGIIYAVKALIVIIKKKDRLVICDGKAVIDGIVEYEEEEQVEENA